MSRPIADLLAESVRLNRTGRYREALGRAMEAVELSEAGGLLRACAWSSAGFALRALGQPRDAERLLRAALAGIGDAVGEHHPEYATCLSNLASVLRATGRHLEAKRAYERALEIRRAFAVTPEDVDVAESLHNLAVVHLELGEHAAALERQQQALAIWRSALGRRHPVVAQGLNNLGAMYHQMGAYREAVEALDEALAMRRGRPGDEPVKIAETLGNLASLYHDIGDNTATIPLLEEALDLRRELLGEDHPSVADTLGKLAVARRRGGDYSLAADLEQRALAIRWSADPPDFAGIALSLGHMATMSSDLGRYETALKFHRGALAATLRAHGDRHPEVARNLGNLAVTLLRADAADEAEPLLREALDVARAALGDDHRDVSIALFNLAQACAAMGRPAEALERFEEASRIDSRALGEVFSIASEAQRAGYLDLQRHHLDVFLAFVRAHRAELPDAVRAGFELVLRRKAVEAEMLAAQREAVLAGRYSGHRDLLRDLRALRAQIARTMLDGPGVEGADEHRRLLHERRRKQEDIEARLAREIPELELQRASRDADLATLAAAVPDGRVVVEIVRGQPSGGSENEPRYDAFVLDPERPGTPAMIDLGAAEEIDAAIVRLRDVITLSRAHAGARQRFPYAGEQLRRLVFDPLLPALGRSRRILLSPDGLLHHVPFGLLPLAGGGHVSDEYDIDYLSCGRDVLRFGAYPGRRAATPVVVADPDFDLGLHGIRAPSALRPDWDTFGTLADTRAEGMAVGRMLGVAPWLGADALEGRLKDVSGPEILHLATHGFVDATPVENPLLHSGLALAGANAWLAGHPPDPPAEDGILTAEDVTGMDLMGTELVVLSACDAGLGVVRAGEGVMGLRRAFTLAGARTLVMSLFKVPDARTREFMEEFYGRFLGEDGATCADALREAQRALRRRYPGELSWGFFICQGDPSLRRRAAQD